MCPGNIAIGTDTAALTPAKWWKWVKNDTILVINVVLIVVIFQCCQLLAYSCNESSKVTLATGCLGKGMVFFFDVEWLLVSIIQMEEIVEVSYVVIFQ